MLNKEGYSVGAVASFLDRARDIMPADIPKSHQSRFFYLRGAVRADLRDIAGAVQDFETALSIWPTPDNMAIKTLEDLYRQTGNERALQAMRERVSRFKTLKR
jgi:hypothetical protein